MRRTTLIMITLVLPLLACQGEPDFGTNDVGRSELASKGGVIADGEPHYEAVAAIKIVSPPATPEEENVGGDFPPIHYCTGVLVEERTVLTAATCVQRNVKAELNPGKESGESYLGPDSITIQFGLNAASEREYVLDETVDDSFPEKGSHGGVTLYRYFDVNVSLPNKDIALLRLSESPGITPVAINDVSLDESQNGVPLELVGYGKGDDAVNVNSFSIRTVVTPLISDVQPATIRAGGGLGESMDKNTCYADGGGPGFLEINNEVRVASVTSSFSFSTDDCSTPATRHRVDQYNRLFIAPFIKRFSDPCVGPDCDNCEYDGVCKEDCPTRDWDCDLGIMTGDLCQTDGECEEGGRCVLSLDVDNYMYCAKPCDPASSGGGEDGCPTGMTCGDSSECEFDGQPPGTQGTLCNLADDCFADGVCEGGFCAFACSSSADCDVENGFDCLPGENVAGLACIKVPLDTSGVGGFCSASGDRSLSSATTCLACMWLCIFLGAFRSRRRVL